MIRQAKAYAEGTDYHTGGAAIIGEAGEPELVKIPNKSPFWITKPALIPDLPKGTSVTPLHDFEYTNTTDMEETNELLRQLVSKKSAAVTVDVGGNIGMRLKRDLGTLSIINKKFKINN